jgi:hypothetical protein
LVKEFIKNIVSKPDICLERGEKKNIYLSAKVFLPSMAELGINAHKEAKEGVM